MSKSFKLQIPNPCNEDWNSFKKTEKGGFCDSCSKEVIDFSRLSDQEIRDYFKNASGRNVCGRVHPFQLNRELVAPPLKSSAIKLGTMALSLAALLSTSQAEAQKACSTDLQMVEEEKERNLITGKISLPKADTRVYSGKVIDVNTKEPIPGADVALKGTDRSTVTDIDGNFAISTRSEDLKEADTFVVSVIGYETVERALSVGVNEIQLYLAPQLNGEVVIVGGITSGSFFQRMWWRVKGWFY